jgi:hypothetical protein
VAVAPSPVAAASSAPSAGPTGRILATHVLPDLPLAAFQNAKLPGSVANDRGMLLGGIGSDLWHGHDDAPDVFWMVTDRGPNGQILVDAVNRRTFPIPEYTPTIIKVRAAHGTIEILQTMPILGQSGKPVTGLSNIEGFDEVPYDYRAETVLTYNPNGLDSEGLVRTMSGDFWLADEYSPSLVKVDASGKVVKRYVPAGFKLSGTDYSVADTLPAIYAKRKLNRGFEGLALSPDQKTLFIALQSPLLNPDAATGNPSRIGRILAFDIATEKPVGEYAYVFEPVLEFDTTLERLPTEMKISGLIATGPDSLIVLERTDWVAKLYRVDLKAATNLLGTPWDDVATTPSLEALADLPADLNNANVKPLPKALVVDLHTIEGVPDKIEGVTMLDRSTLVIANDNDFDIGTFDEAGNNVGLGTKSRILVIGLPSPLP